MNRPRGVVVNRHGPAVHYLLPYFNPAPFKPAIPTPVKPVFNKLKVDVKVENCASRVRAVYLEHCIGNEIRQLKPNMLYGGSEQGRLYYFLCGLPSASI